MRYLLLVLAFFFTACQSPTGQSERDEDRKKINENLEISLKADREQLDELRKEIPADKKAANDELAMQLNLMKGGSEKPHVVQQKFNSAVQKRRSEFRAKVQRLRENYRKEETKRRDEFLSNLKKKREDFTRSKHDIKENREFFSEQDKERQKFFADERDRRQNFEAELNAQSKDFDSYMRERSQEFNEQFRIYSKEYTEREKAKAPKAGGPRGFEQLKNVDTQPLGTEN